MKRSLSAVLLLVSGLAFAQAPREPREMPDRNSARQSAMEKAQGWRDAPGSASLDEEAVRKSGSAEKGVEDAARNQAPGGGSAEGVMKLFEQEVEKGLSGVPFGR